jgi:glutamine synthetase
VNYNVGIPIYVIDKDSFVNGHEKLDVSSIVGFKAVNHSDMILMPNPTSFKILPNDYNPGNRKNVRIFCDLYNGSVNKESRYNRDSRGIVHKASEKLRELRITHTNWGCNAYTSEFMERKHQCNA